RSHRPGGCSCWRAGDASAPRGSAEVCAVRRRPSLSLASNAVGRPYPLAARDLLACCGLGAGGMAHSSRVQPGIAIGGVAHRRAWVISRCGPPFLVASRPTVAEYPNLAAMDDLAVSLPRYVALRHSVRLPYFLRPGGLPGLPQRAEGVEAFSAGRSGMRWSPDVGLHHDF